MAIAAQGYTVTWGTATLTEIRELDIDRSRGLPASRSGGWSPNMGSVRLLSFSANQIPNSDYGAMRRFVVSVPTSAGTAQLVNQDAVFENSSISSRPNEAVQFAYVLRLMSTTAT